MIELKLNDNEIIKINGKEFKVEDILNLKYNQLEFNEENIREIAKRCIGDAWVDEWYTFGGEVSPRYIDKETFMNEIIENILWGGVMCLTTRDWHRGIGKSYFIKEISKAFNIPVLRSHEYSDEEIECYTNVNRFIGHKLGMKVLVDETDVETVSKLREMGMKPIGFACTYKNYEII